MLERPTGGLPKTGSNISSYSYSLIGLLLIGAGIFGDINSEVQKSEEI